MSSPPPSQAKKPSRILALLDGEELPFPSAPLDLVSAQNTGLKRAFGSLENGLQLPSDPIAEGSGKKRRASGLDVLQNNLIEISESPTTITKDAAPLLSQLLEAQKARLTERSTVSQTSTKVPQFHLRYEADPYLRKIDIGGDDQALRMAEFVTKTIDNAFHGLTIATAMEKLGLQDKKDLIAGLEVRLLPHQAIGVSWMVAQEKNPKCKGGILADDMGLGKTVQMIATMTINQPRDNESHKSTLIVVPAALLLQWKEEIESKTNDIFTVHIHHGKDKLKSPADLGAYDVIITSYGTLTSDTSVPSSVEPGDELDWLFRHGGPMARTKWYRIIADEAQLIRNRTTRASKAMAMLRAKYRWCLTGTPVTNNLGDIYGLIRFGHFRPWNDWVSFNEFIGKVQLQDAPLAGMRAQEILKPLLLRRTKNSELEGEPLLQLPEKHIELLRIEFSEEERELYDRFEKRAQISLNKFIRNNCVLKQHSAVLVMILRLRQLCGHPNLILSQSEGFEDPTLIVGSEQEKEVARAARAMGASWVVGIKQRFLERAKASRFDYDDDPDTEEAVCPVCEDFFVNDSGRVLVCGHEICFDCMMDLHNSPIAHNGIFGEGDEQTNLQDEKDYETAAAKGLRPCPICKKMNDLRPSHTFRSSAFEPTEEEFKSATRRASTRPTTKMVPSSSSRPTYIKKSYTADDVDKVLAFTDSSDDEFPDISTLIKNCRSSPPAQEEKGKGKRRIVSSDDDSENEALDMTINKHKKKQARRSSSVVQNQETSTISGGPSAALINTWRRGDDNLEPSAKMLALVRYLKEWEVTGDKTIVYSQWTSMLDLVEILFSRHGIQNLRYDGKMNREAREAVLARFRKPGGPKVILISTKCGGVGLNLVSANRVLNLDLSWNYATESQAYDRVHRLGQEKEVFVKRIVVSNTIEDRMLQLQDTKTGLAEVALGEGGGFKLHKLSVRELRALFGLKNPTNDPNPSQ